MTVGHLVFAVHIVALLLRVGAAKPVASKQSAAVAGGV
jgi:hypothetical protein